MDLSRAPSPPHGERWPVQQKALREYAQLRTLYGGRIEALGARYPNALPQPTMRDSDSATVLQSSKLTLSE